MRTRVKICCIATPAEAALAVGLGADAVGLVAAMPSGPGPIPDGLIREIAALVPAGIDTFLLTSRSEPALVVEHVRDCGTTVVQLVAPVGLDVYTALRQETPTVGIVQVIHVEGEAALAQAERVAEHVDAILLDSGRPSAATPELGGTGRTHDWRVSRRIVRELPRPVYLAGGLRPENVAPAIEEVGPFGVDVCSGVRRDGRLDETALRAFMAAVHGDRYPEPLERMTGR